jgi:hypothetical protein
MKTEVNVGVLIITCVILGMSDAEGYTEIIPLTSGEGLYGL